MPEVGAWMFWLSTGLVFHSYVVFPAHMRRLGRKAKTLAQTTHFPDIDIVLAAYNEAAVIEQKIRSSFNTHYPGKVRLFIGTDACTDATDALIGRLKLDFPALEHRIFLERSGKPTIINQLVAEATAEILVLTDADAFFYPETLGALAAGFAQPHIGGVQADVDLLAENSNEVARQEVRYTYREMEIKAGEGQLGCVIGAFGAAYAIRRALYRPVPAGFNVDDFFIFMAVLQQGYQTVFSSTARYNLLLSGEADVQFRRKRRIGKGNFQNLLYFGKLLFKVDACAYAFWSHKTLRWLTPVLLIIAFVGAVLASTHAPTYGLFAAIMLFLAFLAGLDHGLFAARGYKLSGIRFIRHFLLMNLALLFGLFDLLRGDTRSHWNNKA